MNHIKAVLLTTVVFGPFSVSSSGPFCPDIGLSSQHRPTPSSSVSTASDGLPRNPTLSKEDWEKLSREAQPRVSEPKVEIPTLYPARPANDVEWTGRYLMSESNANELANVRRDLEAQTNLPFRAKVQEAVLRMRFGTISLQVNTLSLQTFAVKSVIGKSLIVGVRKQESLSTELYPSMFNQESRASTIELNASIADISSLGLIDPSWEGIFVIWTSSGDTYLVSAITGRKLQFTKDSERSSESEEFRKAHTAGLYEFQSSAKPLFHLEFADGSLAAINLSQFSTFNNLFLKKELPSFRPDSTLNPENNRSIVFKETLRSRMKNLVLRILNHPSSRVV